MIVDPKLGSWSIHYQQPWIDQAGNKRAPMALRVTWLAYGNHRANGHANFAQQEVANALGKFDDTGTFNPADRRTVSRAIRQAIDWGLLAEGSGALCLIVPAHRQTGGPGDPNALCKRHHRAKRAERRLRAVS